MNKKLYHKFITNSCTQEELLRIFILFGTEDTEILKSMIHAELINKDNVTDPVFAKDQNTLLHVKENLNQYINKQRDIPTLNVRRFNWRWIQYAAVLLTVGFAGYFWFSLQQKPDSLVHVEPLEDVAPLNGTAYIQLGDNTSIPLRPGQQLIMDEQSIGYTDGEKIDQSGWMTDSIRIVTAAGGTYALQLNDGTKVWLNAKSKLTYPMKWGNERRVSMEGEVFFEVAPDAHRPFFVQAQSQEIRVMGTAFNVNSYADQGEIKSTLLHGSIALAIQDKDSHHFNYQTTLKPGQETIYHIKKHSVHLQKANMKAIMAWKNNVFYFSNTPLEELMKTIERWYDVDVIYQNANFKEVFNGEIDRNNSLKELLVILENSGLTSKLLRVDGKNTIVISNKTTL